MLSICFDFNNKRRSNRTFLLLMEKRKGQNKKNGHVSTPHGRRFKLCKLSRCSHSLRLACLSRLLSHSSDAWKAIPNYYFST